MHYWLVICHRGMPTNRISNKLIRLVFLTMGLGTTLILKPHLQTTFTSCKQQQTASGNNTCTLMFMPGCVSVSDYETWYTGTQYHIYKFVNNNKQPQACKLPITLLC